MTSRKVKKSESEEFVGEAAPDFLRWMNAPRFARPEGNPLKDARISDVWIELRGRLNLTLGLPESWIDGPPPARGDSKPVSGTSIPERLVIRKGLQRRISRRPPGFVEVPFDITMKNGQPVRKYGNAILNVKALDDLRAFYLRVLMAWSAEPTLMNRVRVCAYCGRFFLLKTAAPRPKGVHADVCKAESCRTAHQTTIKAKKAERDSINRRRRRARHEKHASTMATLVGSLKRTKELAHKYQEGPSALGRASIPKTGIK